MNTDPTYYSQAGQDKWIAELFNFKRNGLFVDIGAFDGVNISNTYFLEKELNWNGLCVDANPQNFELLVANRSCRRLLTAITDYDGECFFTDNTMYGSISESGRKSTCNKLETVFDHCKLPTQIDYLSLDIEGNELKALSVFPFNKYHIKAITVEHNFYKHGGLYKDGLYALLTKNGFIRMQEPVVEGYHFEDWYVHKTFEL